jgi:arsenate reductase
MRYVLFVCTHNAGRSQMAQAFFERFAPDDVRAESAGQEPRREGVWPNVIEAMGEVGIDLATRRPQRLTVEQQLHADWAVTLACGGTCPFVPTTVEDWDIADPAGLTVAETRLIRDQIELRVRDLIDHRLEAIRSDRTAHQRRLASLLPGLVEQFAGRRSDAEIRLCADAILAQYIDVPVRSFILPLAHRQIRDCLAADVCHVLEAV